MHTMADPLRRAYRTSPSALAAVCGADRLTYAETWARCRRLVGGLRAMGLASGDRVAILAANCHRYLEAYQAIPAGGFSVVPLNTRHAEPELRYALADSGTRVLITDRDPGSLGDLVETVVRLPDDYEALLAGAEEAGWGEGVAEDDLAGLFYTGGTTGASKGVMLTHRNLVANTFHWLAFSQLGPEDRFLVMAPLFHAAGSNGVLATVWSGASHVVFPAFDPARALELVEAEGVTAALGVPTMVAAVAEEQLARPRDVSGLRHFAHGGSPIATEVVRRAAKAFPAAEFVHLYGATELAPLATGLRHEQDLLDTPVARSCGQPIVGVDVRVVGPDGAELPPGEVGEVVVRGPNVMAGYWNKPEQTAAVLQDGAYRTGDLGYLDETSHLFLVDRAKDMIVTGGENVYCTEVEEALYAHPMVLEATVFGVPDERWGEAVHAVVVPRGEVGPEELRAHCRERIAGYKVPKSVELRSEPLPKSGPGKVLKRELREPFWAGRTASIN